MKTNAIRSRHGPRTPTQLHYQTMSWWSVGLGDQSLCSMDVWIQLQRAGTQRTKARHLCSENSRYVRAEKIHQGGYRHVNEPRSPNDPTSPTSPGLRFIRRATFLVDHRRESASPGINGVSSVRARDDHVPLDDGRAYNRPVSTGGGVKTLTVIKGSCGGIPACRLDQTRSEVNQARRRLIIPLGETRAGEEGCGLPMEAVG